MRSVIPEAKLLYVVRDPFERIVSHWIHDVAEGRERRDLATCLTDLEGNGYVAASRYFAQLERFLAAYPRERLLVLRLDDLERARVQTLARVFGFLGVDASFRSPRFGRVEHRSSEKRSPTDLGRRLVDSSLVRLLSRLPAPVSRRMLRVLTRPFTRPVGRPSVPPHLRRGVREHLRADGRKLERLTGMDLSAWYD
jgi:hypothetical protein